MEHRELERNLRGRFGLTTPYGPVRCVRKVHDVQPMDGPAPYEVFGTVRSALLRIERMNSTAQASGVRSHTSVRSFRSA
jgi:hypothetical protein